MKILLLAPQYMDLYKSIVEEIEGQGHDVIWIEDDILDCDWHQPWRGIRDKLNRIAKNYLHNYWDNYWKQKIKENADINSEFDLLLAINGYSANDYFFEFVERNNPKIKKVLYLWDNSQFYDFFHNAKHFDKIFTYDIRDSQKYHVSFMPIYWKEIKPSPEITEPKYCISMVGTNHSNRLKIAKAVASQLQNLTKPYFLKILDTTLPEDDFVIHKPISPDDYMQIILDSDCVFDTDRESQTGSTVRMIWALGLGKKIITTNKTVKELPYYSPKRIAIIDRENPVIDIDFITSKAVDNKVDEYLRGVRIDNWVKKLIKL